MIDESIVTQAPDQLLKSFAQRALAYSVAMIHVANKRAGKEVGDPKTGGHPASCASAVHILTALHLAARQPQDYVVCKPHTSPVDHSLHHLMQVFRHGKGSERPEGSWFDAEEAEAVMHRLRQFPEHAGQPVFQSYHASSDPDCFHILPSGSVGIPPVVSVYLALAYRYAEHHDWPVPANAQFWSLMGDSEFREGSLLEALPEVAERQLGNVTWIVDYNRQSLDGTRLSTESALGFNDADRIEHTALANGWEVIQLRHGELREQAFTLPGGEALRELFENGLSDYEYQMLLLHNNPGEVRDVLKEKDDACAAVVDSLDDGALWDVFLDLGGHCVTRLRLAYEQCRVDPLKPTLIVAHTLKGYGLECLANPANHSILPSSKEIEEILEEQGLSLDRPFLLPEEGSDEAEFLRARSDLFRAGILEAEALRDANMARFQAGIEEGGGMPDTFDIDASLFPFAHTQWMWGQVASKLARLGSHSERLGNDGLELAPLEGLERQWQQAGEFVLTLSPDVGTSTNISPVLNTGIYGPPARGTGIEDRLGIRVKHPELKTSEQARTRHIRFDITEANATSAQGAFGKMGDLVGLPMTPILTIYDFFIKRALDQLYYNLYWQCDFIVIGTPSGVTLSSEGAQHSWKSDLQIPNLITWEPTFALEVDWIMADAIRRQHSGENAGRSGVLIRASTRGMEQAQLLRWLKRQAKSKAAPAPLLAPAGAGAEWGGTPEDTLPALSDAELLERLRSDCLTGAYKLIDWEGYAGYEPGDNVVNIFTVGSPGTEAIEASEALLARGIFANVIVITSTDLLLGGLAEANDYAHLRQGLGINGDLHAVEGAGASEAGLISLAGRRVPCVAVIDGEAGLVDNIGSIVGVRQQTCAVRRFSKCGRPSQVYAYQSIDGDSIISACGKVLCDTALENLQVSPGLLERLAGRATSRPDWRKLWPANSTVDESDNGNG